jgi:hypothetical protein
VAERALHDFFYNVRRLVGSMVRVKLFGLFVGVEDMGGDGEKLSHLQVAGQLRDSFTNICICSLWTSRCMAGHYRLSP